MSQPLLAFNEVDVFYGPIQALKQVSLTVNEGETVALIGTNGKLNPNATLGRKIIYNGQEYWLTPDRKSVV